VKVLLLVAAVAACGTNSMSTVPVTVPGQPTLMTYVTTPL
jgi:hypothetical protein